MKKVLLTALFAILFAASPHFVLAQESDNTPNDGKAGEDQLGQTSPQTGTPTTEQPTPTTGQPETPTPAPNPTPSPSGTGTTAR